ncbi:MAG TPA: hypothetical protein VLH79_02310 [Chthonomonadales bacterium]|nr:hypothetical protein [Chthonomonadales bacterium]
MGAKLLKYIDFVGQNGGLAAKMRLAMLTNIPSAKAEAESDSPANIEKFRRAVKEVTGLTAPDF